MARLERRRAPPAGRLGPVARRRHRPSAPLAGQVADPAGQGTAITTPALAAPRHCHPPNRRKNPGCHCLARSITLSNWLNRAGHANTLKIGISGTATTLKSHSWVEKDGQILDDTPENTARFQKITEI